MRKLSDLKENNKVFKLPENYFEEFQSRMSDLTESNALQKSKSFSLLKPAVLSPLIVILLTASYFLFSTYQTEQAESLADIATVDLLDFLEEDGVSEDELLSFIENTSEAFDMNTFPESDMLEEFDSNDLEDIINQIELNEYL